MSREDPLPRVLRTLLSLALLIAAGLKIAGMTLRATGGDGRTFVLALAVASLELLLATTLWVPTLSFLAECAALGGFLGAAAVRVIGMWLFGAQAQCHCLGPIKASDGVALMMGGVLVSMAGGLLCVRNAVD